MLRSQYFEFEFVVKVLGVSSLRHIEEDYLDLLHTQKSHVKKQSIHNLLTTFCSFTINSHNNHYYSFGSMIEPNYWTILEARHQVFAVQHSPF